VFELITGINEFLTTPTPLRAVAFGLALSWGGTQWFKHRKPVKRLDEQTYRITVQVIAFALAWVPVALLWPAPIAERMLAAVTTGICAPFTYTFVARIAYKFFPWLEPKLSAKPKDGDA
jgi:hypothetical protein